MTNLIKISETLSNLTLLSKVTEREDYEKCEFVNCTFVDISNLNFINCIFKNCNLSNCKINNAKLQGVHFVDCKLLGLNFFQAKDFAFEVCFVQCLLDYASFDSKKLNKSEFKHCKMHEVNFLCFANGRRCLCSPESVRNKMLKILKMHLVLLGNRCNFSLKTRIFSIFVRDFYVTA